MNRIILIGNGFDRAHGLKTSYKHFIDWFWKRQAEMITDYRAEFKQSGSSLRDANISIFIGTYRTDWVFEDCSEINSFEDFKSKIQKYREKPHANVNFTIKNKFLEYISNIASLQKWVDIEEIYHQFLNAISKKKDIIYRGKIYEYENIEALHTDFEQIKIALEEYLTEITKDQLIPIIPGMKDLIYSDIEIKDLTSEGVRAIAKVECEKIRAHFRSGDVYNPAKIYVGTEKHLSDEELIDSIIIDLSTEGYEKGYYKLSPDNLLFLNFNYTNMEKLYGESEDEVIHIHGELNNTRNPLIFGYGDEIGEEYKQLEKLNDNRYLENIKSIKYLETDNYKRLLSFAESDQYQVFVFGHSCGNSDRTLLHTLLEHQNCVSVKVFYHGTDEQNNYSDVIRNISRNFNDKTSFREKVVNKEYCCPLPQAEE